jgi:putative hydrolase of the HAD superfamily
MAVKAITFDFWSTLFRDANSAPRQQMRIDALAREAGVSPEKASGALDLVWPEFSRSHREDRRTLTPHDAVRFACRFLKVVLDDSVMDDLTKTFATAILEFSPEPIEGAFDAVKAAAAVLPVGLISDTGVSPGSSLKELMDREGFTPYFRSLVFSDVVGVSKPQAAMFERSASDLGVGPNELFHIGDLEYTDILGAKSVGSLAARFVADNPGTSPETEADYTFAAWSEFIDALPSILNRK